MSTPTKDQLIQATEEAIARYPGAEPVQEAFAGIQAFVNREENAPTWGGCLTLAKQMRVFLATADADDAADVSETPVCDEVINPKASRAPAVSGPEFEALDDASKVVRLRTRAKFDRVRARRAEHAGDEEFGKLIRANVQEYNRRARVYAERVRNLNF